MKTWLRCLALGAVLVGVAAGDARAVSIFDGYAPYPGFYPSIGFSWSFDFNQWDFLGFGSPSDAFNFHGVGSPNVYTETTLPSNPFTITAARAQGTGYFPLPLDASGSLSLTLSGGGAPTSPSNVQRLHIVEHLTNAQTNQYGFGAGSSGRLPFQISGAEDVYWAADVQVAVTEIPDVNNVFSNVNLFLRENNSFTDVINTVVNASGIYTGSAFGFFPGGGSPDFSFNVGFSTNQTEVLVIADARFAFSSNPITSIPPDPPAAVPEPAFAALALLGSAVAAAFRRRRR